MTIIMGMGTMMMKKKIKKKIKKKKILFTPPPLIYITDKFILYVKYIINMLSRFCDMIDLKLFLFSFFIGILFVYTLGADRKTVYMYPSPNTYKDIVIQDDVGNCFKYDQKKLSCEKNKDKITSFPVQYESTEKEREEDKTQNKILGIF